MKRRKKAILFIIACYVVVIAGLVVLYLVAKHEQQSLLAALPALPVEEPAHPGDPAPGPAPLALHDFAALRQVHEDAVAWLTINATGIDEPVVQSEDNRYYLDHNSEKKKTAMGALFLDCRAPADFTEFSSVVYGHNLKSGRRFGTLSKFKEKDYFEAHRTGRLYIQDNTYELEIFACAVVSDESDWYRYAFSSEGEKQAHLEMIEKSALLYKQIAPPEQILILSTCSYEFGEARTVVAAAMLDSEALNQASSDSRAR